MRHERHSNPLQRLNEDHADGLLVAARALSGHPDATAARAEGVDRHGIDVQVETPRGRTAARLEFAEPIAEHDYPGGVRVAFVRLVRRARTASARTSGDDAAAS